MPARVVDNDGSLCMVGMDQIGDETQSKRRVLTVTYSTKCGFVTNWFHIPCASSRTTDIVTVCCRQLPSRKLCFTVHWHVTKFHTEWEHSFTTAAEREIGHSTSESSDKEKTYEFLSENTFAVIETCKSPVITWHVFRICPMYEGSCNRQG